MEQFLSFFNDNKDMIYFIILSVFVGVEVIGGVPTTLL
jgi:NAD(P) transhydrogenase subunit alpha